MVGGHFWFTVQGWHAARDSSDIMIENRHTVYAIGDVHGRLDLLKTLLQKIMVHAIGFDRVNAKGNAEKNGNFKIIFLGDFIDRGPDSAGCMELIINLCRGNLAIALLGNHEDLLLASADGNHNAQNAWLALGGLATLSSYAIPPISSKEDSYDFAERIKLGIPKHHLAFLRELPLSYVHKDYLFVHAGIRPGIPISLQAKNDLITIRREFTESLADHGHIVVHGHSSVDSVEIRPNRIACDTSAYCLGKLSCVAIGDGVISVLST